MTLSLLEQPMLDFPNTKVLAKVHKYRDSLDLYEKNLRDVTSCLVL